MAASVFAARSGAVRSPDHPSVAVLLSFPARPATGVSVRRICCGENADRTALRRFLASLVAATPRSQVLAYRHWLANMRVESRGLVFA